MGIWIKGVEILIFSVGYYMVFLGVWISRNIFVVKEKRRFIYCVIYGSFYVVWEEGIDGDNGLIIFLFV